jgi:hypothetical protein
MESQQMIELLLKEIRAGQEKADANQANRPIGGKTKKKLEPTKLSCWL